VVRSAPGLPANTSVSSVEASRHDRGVAHATFDGHMSGDMKTYVYRTADFGKTWTPLATAELRGFAHVVRQDPVKADLLFLGTEFGLFFTLDGGRHWAQVTGNLPSVAVRDLAIQPREHDLIVATHGRGIYIVDDFSPIRQITAATIDAPFTLLESRPGVARMPSLLQTFTGADEFSGENPPEAAYVHYYLRERHMVGDFTIEIRDSAGRLVSTLPAGRRRGINRVAWPMRLKPPEVPPASSLEFNSLTGPTAPEGAYTATIRRGEENYHARIEISGDPASPHAAEDRRPQQVTVMRLYRLLERLAFVSAMVTGARDQLDMGSKKLPAGESLARDLAELRDQLDQLHKTLVATREGGRLTGEMRLREYIGELYGEVSRYGGRPTRTQIERAGTLEQEVESASRRFASLTGPALDGLNRRLRERQIEAIRVLTEEEYEKRTGLRSAAPNR